MLEYAFLGRSCLSRREDASPPVLAENLQDVLLITFYLLLEYCKDVLLITFYLLLEYCKDVLLITFYLLLEYCKNVLLITYYLNIARMYYLLLFTYYLNIARMYYLLLNLLLFPYALHASSHILVNLHKEVFGAVFSHLFLYALVFCHGVLF